MKKQYIPAQIKIVSLNGEQSVLLSASPNTYINPSDAMSKKKRPYDDDSWEEEFE